MNGRKAGAAPPVDLEALADALTPRVAERLLARLALALGAIETLFSTRPGHEPPEPPEFVGRRRAWLASAKTIPGAMKLGRWWSVPRQAYATWLTSQAKSAAPATTDAKAHSPANDPHDVWTPRAALLSVGIRPTREAPK